MNGVGGDQNTFWGWDRFGDCNSYEFDSAPGGAYLLAGILRIVGTELQYGDGNNQERDSEGLLTGESGTPQEIGYNVGVLRYAEETTGLIREIEGDDTGVDDTAGKIGYELGGTPLRFVESAGNKREEQGVLA